MINNKLDVGSISGRSSQIEMVVSLSLAVCCLIRDDGQDTDRLRLSIMGTDRTLSGDERNPAHHPRFGTKAGQAEREKYILADGDLRELTRQELLDQQSVASDLREVSV